LPGHAADVDRALGARGLAEVAGDLLEALDRGDERGLMALLGDAREGLERASVRRRDPLAVVVGRKRFLAVPVVALEPRAGAAELLPSASEIGHERADDAAREPPPALLLENQSLDVLGDLVGRRLLELE